MDDEALQSVFVSNLLVSMAWSSSCTQALMWTSFFAPVMVVRMQAYLEAFPSILVKLSVHVFQLLDMFVCPYTSGVTRLLPANLQRLTVLLHWAYCTVWSRVFYTCCIAGFVNMLRLERGNSSHVLCSCEPLPVCLRSDLQLKLVVYEPGKKACYGRPSPH